MRCSIICPNVATIRSSLLPELLFSSGGSDVLSGGGSHQLRKPQQDSTTDLQYVASGTSQAMKNASCVDPGLVTCQLDNPYQIVGRPAQGTSRPNSGRCSYVLSSGDRGRLAWFAQDAEDLARD